MANPKPLPQHQGGPLKPGPRLAAFPPPDFRTLFESIPGFYLVFARDLTIIAASDAYLQLAGAERETTVGRKLSSVFSDAANPFAGFTRSLAVSLQKARDTGMTDTMTLSARARPQHEGGFEERFWTFVNTPILNLDGSTAWIIHRAEDVTELIRLKQADRERQELGEELAGLYEKSRDLDRLKTSFFANVSYEFRTALESILGLVEDARAQTEGAVRADDLRTVHFNALRLLKLTNSLLDFATAEGMPIQSTPAVEKTNGPSHILIADDSPAMRSYLSGLLSPEFRVSLAENGEAAVTAVRIDRPDLIMSDVTMPVIDGISLVRGLKEDPETSSIPIILHSAGGSEDDCVTAVEAGADDYLPKSVSARELLSRIRTHLELSQAHRARAAAVQEIARSRPGKFEAGFADMDHRYYRLSLEMPPPPHIAGLINMLERNFGIILDSNGRRYLSNLDARKMDALIDILLSFSRMNRAEMRKVPIDLRSLVEAVIDQQIGEHHLAPPTQWVLGDLPCIRADAAMLRVVLDNLISNALKFSSGRPERRIEISAADSGAGNVLFYVRDNGTGFDMEHAENLFGVFHRLPSHEEFDGSGVGLAIVRRIIQKHDGQVWATGTVGQGATFYCSLPAESGN